MRICDRCGVDLGTQGESKNKFNIDTYYHSFIEYHMCESCISQLITMVAVWVKELKNDTRG